jgi:hypothetical protein
VKQPREQGFRLRAQAQQAAEHPLSADTSETDRLRALSPAVSR